MLSCDLKLCCYISEAYFTMVSYFKWVYHSPSMMVLTVNYSVTVETTLSETNHADRRTYHGKADADIFRTTSRLHGFTTTIIGYDIGCATIISSRISTYLMSKYSSNYGLPHERFHTMCFIYKLCVITYMCCSCRYPWKTIASTFLTVNHVNTNVGASIYLSSVYYLRFCTDFTWLGLSIKPQKLSKFPTII